MARWGDLAAKLGILLVMVGAGWLFGAAAIHLIRSFSH